MTVFLLVVESIAWQGDTEMVAAFPDAELCISPPTEIPRLCRGCIFQRQLHSASLIPHTAPPLLHQRWGLCHHTLNLAHLGDCLDRILGSNEAWLLGKVTKRDRIPPDSVLAPAPWKPKPPCRKSASLQATMLESLGDRHTKELLTLCTVVSIFVQT